MYHLQFAAASGSCSSNGICAKMVMIYRFTNMRVNDNADADEHSLLLFRGPPPVGEAFKSTSRAELNRRRGRQSRGCCLHHLALTLTRGVHLGTTGGEAEGKTNQYTRQRLSSCPLMLLRKQKDTLQSWTYTETHSVSHLCTGNTPPTLRDLWEKKKRPRCRNGVLCMRMATKIWVKQRVRPWEKNVWDCVWLNLTSLNLVDILRGLRRGGAVRIEVSNHKVSWKIHTSILRHPSGRARRYEKMWECGRMMMMQSVNQPKETTNHSPKMSSWIPR